jgi:hypothetical protein
MKAMKTTLLVLLVGMLVLPGLIWSQGNKGPGDKVGAGKKEEVKLKYVDIQAQINPKFNYLSEIGVMIDNARQDKDGDGLLAATLVLCYAEMAAGKKGTAVTAEGLLNEAGDLAKEQKNAKLARAIAGFWGNAMLGFNNKVKGDEFVKLAKDYDAIAGANRGYGWIRIDNESSYFVDVYIDGYAKGRLYSGYYEYYKIWEGETKLYAEAPYTEPDNYFWGPRFVELGDDETYTWTITD